MNNTITKDFANTTRKSVIYRKKYKASMDSTVSLGFGWWRVQTSQGILTNGRGVFRWADIEPNQDSFDFSRTDSLEEDKDFLDEESMEEIEKVKEVIRTNEELVAQ